MGGRAAGAWRTAGLLLIVACLGPATARADSVFAVTSTADLSDTTPGDGSCQASNGQCTLRAAVEEADALNGNATIQLPAGTFTLGSNALSVTNQPNLTITGAGPSQTMIDGNFNPGILDDRGGGQSLALSHLSLVHGRQFDTIAFAGSNFSLDDVRMSDDDDGPSGNGLVYVVPPSGATTVTVTNSTFDGDTDGVNAFGNGIFHIGASSANVTLTNDVFAHDSVGTGGHAANGLVHVITTSGGITATVNGTRFTDDVAGTTFQGGGGGMLSLQSAGAGTVQVNDSAFVNDSTYNQGTGLWLFAPGSGTTVDIERSAFVGGTAQYEGGGVNVTASGATLTLGNDTFANNSTQLSGHHGGALFVGGANTTTLTNDTFVGNSEPNSTDGAGIYAAAGTISFANDLLTQNTSGAAVHNCFLTGVTVTDQGHNIDDGGGNGTCGTNATTGLHAQPGDQPGLSPALDAAADNGGPVPTVAPTGLAGPSVDAGDDLLCPAVDARGVPRPQGLHCDIGAYEVAAPLAGPTSATALGTTSATLVSSVDPRGTVGAHFEYGTTPALGATTAGQTVGPAVGARPVSTDIAGLSPQTTYFARVVAAGTAGPTTSFTTAALPPGQGGGSPPAPAAAPPPGASPLPTPQPLQRVRFLASTVSGRVLVTLPGSRVPVSLTSLRALPFGSVVDARFGRVELTTEDRARPGQRDSAQFYEGVFRIEQAPDGVTTLTLTDASALTSGRARATAVRRRRGSTRHLWGGGVGHFRTVGGYGSVTVRGTVWLTADAPGSTLVRVLRGVVTFDVRHGAHIGPRRLSRVTVAAGGSARAVR